MINRAYSVLNIKAVDDEDRRIITGIATTPEPDRQNDIIEPKGAEFKLPIPLLFQHDARQPIGKVTKAKVTADGIEITAQIAKTDEPGTLKARLDEAWQSIKLGLVGGLSIGFKPLEVARIEGSFGNRFLRWEWVELSAVTIAANQQASIVDIKSIDTELRRAASGHTPKPVIVRLSPGVSGSPVTTPKPPQEGKSMTTIAEQIVALENKRAASSSRMEAVMQKTLDEGRTSNPQEQEEFDTLQSEVDAIDKDLVRLRAVEKAKAHAATVIKADNPRDAAVARDATPIVVKREPKLEPGQLYAQVVRCILRSREEYRPPAAIAADIYGHDSRVVHELTTKAAVPAGATVAGNWLSPLIGEETTAVADFVEFLRKQTILGRFGNGGVPALRSVMFRVPLLTQTGGGSGYWVGEGKAKPLTSFTFERRTLEPLKVANICALTNEAIRYSAPKADIIIRDQLAEALRERLDTDFINPAKTAVTGVSPASITNGADTVASSGDDADAIRLDVRSLYAKFSAANNPISTGVWIMSNNTAAALAMMTNPLGQPEFPSMATGASLFMMPVLITDYVSDIVVLVNASDIYLADEGEISIQTSREASLEMADNPAHDSITPTGASLVSMFQTNSTAILAERTINWMRRRDPSVVYLTGVSWGGEVNTV